MLTPLPLPHDIFFLLSLSLSLSHEREWDRKASSSLADDMISFPLLSFPPLVSLVFTFLILLCFLSAVDFSLLPLTSSLSYKRDQERNTSFPLSHAVAAVATTAGLPFCFWVEGVKVWWEWCRDKEKKKGKCKNILPKMDGITISASRVTLW